MMKRMRSSHLKWSNLLLVGVLVLLSFSLRPAYIHPTMKPEKEKIGFIGDSITRSPTGKSGPVEAEMKALKNYTPLNQGRSGSTTADWLPGHILFDDALAIFKAQNVHTVSIMLGTNDARADKATSPATYRRNMERIIENLLGSGVVQLVIVNYPPYVIPGAHHVWDGVATARLQLYSRQLDIIAKERGVAQGDTFAFAYFKDHPYQLADGVHPSPLGNEMLGKLWAKAYQKIINEEASKRRSSSLANIFYVRV
jgi:lysophospholipase L1-like esterase